LQIDPDQLIQAQGPLVMFSKLHEKFCLVVGQGQILEIAHEYPLNFELYNKESDNVNLVFYNRAEFVCKAWLCKLYTPEHFCGVQNVLFAN